MNDTVHSFNNLTRPRTTPDGRPNRWVFGVRHVQLDRPGDLVVAVHLPSRLILQAGTGQIVSQPTASEKAQVLLPLLLDAFVKGTQPPDDDQPPDPPPFAPWSWATEDPELAKALEECLNQHGVVNELCQVGTCSEHENTILEEEWSRLYQKIAGILGLGAQLRHPRHASAVTLGDNSISFPDAAGRLDAHIYYNTTARSSPEAQALVRTLYLDFPSSATQIEGFGKALLSLVYSGKDTPENMQALFGPNWRSSIGRKHDGTRLDVLFDPPRGSLSYAIHQELCPDNRLERSPRPATDAERQVIWKARETQDAIRRRIGAGMSPSSAAHAILSSYGPDWPSHLQAHTLAVKTMDPVIRVD